MTLSIHPNNSDALSAWLRLTLIPGIGGQTQRTLLAAFGLPEAIFKARGSELRRVIGDELAAKLTQHDNHAEVEVALQWLAEGGNHLITLADTAYPPLLLESPDPPVVLYAKGNLACLAGQKISIVGSRNATQQGIRDAESFAAHLSQGGLTVVSGLALGIDAAAHRGALPHAGSTIAVVGTGLDRIYPARNAALARDIAAQGLILSEFPLGAGPMAHHFPRRNRIIAGLSLGCLVIEAAAQSGSLITARQAGEAGREVFAIPGSIHSPLAKGCHQLIRQGAKLVESAADILEDLRLSPLTHFAPAAAAPAEKNLSKEENLIINALGDAPCDIETLVERTGLTPDALLAMLLPMELDGHIASLPGGRYQKLS